MAEYVAMIYLIFKGYHIIKHRYKTPVGEIDILARKRDTLIAVEVKYRHHIHDALASISPHAQKRIINAAKWYISKQTRQNFSTIRMDAIVIGRFAIKHLDNAWQDHP